MEKINVLIVDDNIRTVNMLEEIVQSDEEMNVIGKAENGLDALELIREKEPDVVLLDLIMPKLDGLGVLEKVKKNKDLKKVPSFIVISACKIKQSVRSSACHKLQCEKSISHISSVFRIFYIAVFGNGSFFDGRNHIFPFLDFIIS